MHHRAELDVARVQHVFLPSRSPQPRTLVVSTEEYRVFRAIPDVVPEESQPEIFFNDLVRHALESWSIRRQHPPQDEENELPQPIAIDAAQNQERFVRG